MNPIFVDVILVVISILLIYGGYRQGFIRAAGSLLGLVISIAIGIWGVTWLENVTGFELTRNPVVFIFTFLILSILVSQLLRLIVSALDLVRKLLSIIPFVGLINSLLGTLLGLVQAVLFIGLVAYVAQTYLPVGTIRYSLLNSQLVAAGVRFESAIGLLD
jgi:uncharacterized membrane protein required for colicin V production